MADIVEFSGGKKTEGAAPLTKPGASDGPYLEGEAICGACQHEWQAIQPVGGKQHLECPACHRLWGAFKHAVEPVNSWRCNCGEQLFWLTPTGAMCRRCGKRSNQWAE